VSEKKCTWLVTGGSGFIGSNFIKLARANGWANIINVDKLTYAGNPTNLKELEGDEGYTFVRADTTDREAIQKVFDDYSPDAVVNFAAESHVDRSIDSPGEFVHTNVVGTFTMLEEARRYWSSCADKRKGEFRFLHVSTDEVYGSLGFDDEPFKETTAYDPSSPYSASKAASDHFVSSYYRTYGLPTLTTNCSNNYGPYQFPEKLIPLMVLNAVEEKPLPVYGDGKNIRDWLYVDDHCKAIKQVLNAGRIGETYNIGGRCELTNIDLVRTLCAVLDEVKPRTNGDPYSSLITFVKDRPGHDRRYAIDDSKIAQELDWNPQESFTSGLRKTVEWYLDNAEWTEAVQNGTYRDWIAKNYNER